MMPFTQEVAGEAAAYLAIVMLLAVYLAAASVLGHWLKQRRRQLERESVPVHLRPYQRRRR
jgi:Na+-driven multidrug efflux pump